MILWRKWWLYNWTQSSQEFSLFHITKRGKNAPSFGPQLTMNYERDWKWKLPISLSRDLSLFPEGLACPHCVNNLINHSICEALFVFGRCSSSPPASAVDGLLKVPFFVFLSDIRTDGIKQKKGDSLIFCAWLDVSCSLIKVMIFEMRNYLPNQRNPHRFRRPNNGHQRGEKKRVIVDRQFAIDC